MHHLGVGLGEHFPSDCTASLLLGEHPETVGDGRRKLSTFRALLCRGQPMSDTLKEAQKECKKLKRAYNKCAKEFRSSMSIADISFTGGLFGTSTNPCQDYFDDYRDCVVVRPVAFKWLMSVSSPPCTSANFFLQLAMQTKLKVGQEDDRSPGKHACHALSNCVF